MSRSNVGVGVCSCMALRMERVSSHLCMSFLGIISFKITYIVLSLLDAGFTLEDPLALQPQKKAQINSRKKNPFMPIKTIIPKTEKET